MYKLSITGTHGSGKTTLIELIKRQADLNHYYFVEDGAKSCPINFTDIEFLRRNPSAEHLITEWMVSNIKRLEIEASRHSDFLLCDRSLVDEMVYPLAILRPSPEVDYYKSMVLRWQKIFPYDHIFLAEGSPKWLNDDGKKSIDPEFQIRVQLLYPEVLKELGIPYSILPFSVDNQEVLEDRKKVILEKMRQNGG